MLGERRQENPVIYRVIFAGKQLKNAAKLGSAGISNGSDIHVVLRLGTGSVLLNFEFQSLMMSRTHDLFSEDKETHTYHEHGMTSAISELFADAKDDPLVSWDLFEERLLPWKKQIIDYNTEQWDTVDFVSRREFEQHAAQAIMAAVTPHVQPVARANDEPESSLDSAELCLLNIMYAPPSTRLFSIAKTISTIEILGHALPYTRHCFEPEGSSQYQAVNVDLMELPRLELSWHTRKDSHGVTRLFSIDRPSLAISNVCNDPDSKLAQLLKGLPHALLLQDVNEELHILSPALPMARPEIAAAPFSTELVLIHTDDQWAANLEQPYYLYPIHVSCAYVTSPTLAEALYLTLMRFLARDYEAAFRMIDSIGTDTQYTKEEHGIFQLFQLTMSDMSPDAHACRLKMSLAVLDAPISPPWDVTKEMSWFVSKLAHVSASIRLSWIEQLQLLEKCIVSLDDPRYTNARPGTYSELMVVSNRNRKAYLEALSKGETYCSAWVPKRLR